METQILVFQLNPDSLKELIKAALKEVIDSRAPEPLEPIESPEKFYTRVEVCKRLHISLVTLFEYQKLGIIKAQRFGRRILISETNLQEALKDIPNQKGKRKY